MSQLALQARSNEQSNFSCKLCAKYFDSREALKMHHQAKHISKEEAHLQAEKTRKRKKVKKNLLYVLVVLAFLAVIYGLSVFFQGGGSYSQGQVHWHADLKITACGEDVPLPRPMEGGSIVHGESFIGTPFMHLHHEPKIHIEGTISNAEEIALSRFMDVIGIKFTDIELLDKKNGDLCDESGEKEGRVKLLVNGAESSDLSKHVIADGESYELVFG